MFPEPRSPLPDRRAVLVGVGALGLTAACGATGAQRQDESSARAQLFEHLKDESGSVEPISASEREARRARLGTLLHKAGADAHLMESGATMTYLTGVSWGKSERLFALVVLANGSHFWLVPEFEASRARGQIEAPGGPRGRVITWREDQYATPALVDALREVGCERVVIEPQLRNVFADRLGEALGRERISSGRQLIAELRSVKDEHELRLLARANELTQIAIEAVAATLTPGIDGNEIGARMDAAHRKFGMRSPWNLSLIGPAAALPHGECTPRKLARGEVILIDTGAALHGYQSDVTRTWIFGDARNVEAERVWQVVRDTQRAAIDAIRPGVEARSIDALARQFVATRGFDGGYRDFTHRLGHGIGLEGHEDPYFDGGDRTVLAPGMTLSVEPGLYFEGRFGVRIEDIIAVTHDGCRVFGREQQSARAPA